MQNGTMERIIAVLTEQPAYAQRFCDYANRKRILPLTAVPFTEVGEYTAFCEKHPVRILLTDEGILRAACDGEQEHQLQAEQIIGLAEETPEQQGAKEGSSQDGRDSVLLLCDTVIGKYQSADTILREIMICCENLGMHSWHILTEQKKQMIGIFSPIGRCRKTAFALVLCRILGRSNQPLYLNLEPFSGFSALTGENYSACLSDALYHLKKGSLDTAKLVSMIYTFSGIHYIPPMRFAEDMEELSGSGLAALASQILQESPYDVLVVDAAELTEASSSFLELCSQIYMPVLEDAVSRAKLEEFETYLDAAGKEALKSRLCKLHLPETGLIQYGASYLDDLLYSPLGDYTRALLEGDAGYGKCIEA